MRSDGSGSFEWLTARPIAHRGLHDRASGRFENTLSAARAAIDDDFSIECDVQLSADGDAMVFHDPTLGRLTNETGSLHARSTAHLSSLAIGGTDERIPTLKQLLSLIAGRVPLFCEIKSAFDGDLRLADRVAELSVDYAGLLAFKSFDPHVIRRLRVSRAVTPSRPLGIVAEAAYDDPEWDMLTRHDKRALAALTHFADTKPDFLSYAVDDLPHAGPTLFRAGLGLPVVTWTVRTAVQQERATRWADQIVFEGFVPDDMSHRSALV